MKINGSLNFDASSASEILNLRVQKVSSDPSYISGADNGRMIYNTGVGALKFGSDSLPGWVTIATGGNAAALQTEVDNIETALGSIINSSGNWVVGQVTGTGLTGSEASLTAVLQALAAAITGHDALAELSDVDITGVVNGQFLQFNNVSGKWEDHTLVLADVSDVTATAAEVNVLDGIPATLTAVELGYVDGVTSGIQGQLDNKQPLDATLTALATLSGTGILVETGVDTFAHRSLTAPAAGFTITNPDGVAGSPTFALANDLAAFESLSGTGYVVRTGDGTATTRSLTGTAGNIVVTNGSGVTSDTSIDLEVISQAASGNFVKVTLDGFGRVTGNTAVVAADITALVSGTYVDVSGDAMTGNLAMGTNKITGLGAPTADGDATNKAYVDAMQAGLSWKNAVRAATTTNGVLATDFAAGQTIDGVTLVAGDRILLKNQTAPAENGIYVVQASGAPVRATDMDAAVEFDGAAMFVQEGSVNADSGWTQQATVTTVGTSAVTFSQFSGSATYTWGDGLTLTGNTVNVNLGAGIAQLPTDEVGIDLRDTVNGALILTTDGSTRTTVTGAALHLLLDGTGGLAQTASGLKINAGSVTNAMLTNSVISFNTDAGTPDAVSLGETLQIIGTSAQGVVTSGPAGNTVQVTVNDATTSTKGVASYDSGDFSVTAGVVSVKAAGIDNVQLANSLITMTGDTGSDAVSLGESFALKGASGSPITTNVLANQVDISIAASTYSTLGVASFSATDFTVASGAVSIIQKSITDATDVSDLATPATSGHVLAATGSAWTNKKIYHVHTEASAATTWTVTHALGVQYCNVTVVDASDEVVIPQSITFNSTTQLTVTFNTGVAGKVVVMGIA